jgi:hypothetical protein
MKNKKKILIIAGTHGNERIGIEVLKELKMTYLSQYFDVLMANPKALSKNIRYIDCDLNRAYPGKKYSKYLESRLAYNNLKIAKKYQYVIDLHEASSGTDNFIILPREKLSQKFPLDLIDLKKVLLWPDPKGPLGQVLVNCVELEFGMKGKDRTMVVNQAVKILKKLIRRLCMSQKQLKRPQVEKQVFYVYGKLLIEQSEFAVKSLKDFRKTKLNKEEFYPLLVGQYLSSGIVCYKMRKI